MAAILAKWKLNGWPQMMGRAPTLEDLVVPMAAPTNRGRRVPLGRMRTDHNSYKRLVKDLAALGLRHRRGHDLRRTMITLARSDGARKDILELCTHNPDESTIDIYTSFPWEVLCREVAKMRIRTRDGGNVVAIPMAEGARWAQTGGFATPEFATHLATRDPKAQSSQEDTAWRRRESNPRPRAFHPLTLRV